MKTFDIKRDVVYDGNEPCVIIDEQGLVAMRDSLKLVTDEDQRKYLENTIKYYEDLRVQYADKIREVNITIKKPSPSDRIDIRSACCNGQGLYIGECEPLETCVKLIHKWDLKDVDAENDEDKNKDIEITENNIRNGKMPMCLMDVVYNSAYPYLYPSQARLAFLPQSDA